MPSLDLAPRLDSCLLTRKKMRQYEMLIAHKRRHIQKTDEHHVACQCHFPFCHRKISFLTRNSIALMNSNSQQNNFQ